MSELPSDVALAPPPPRRRRRGLLVVAVLIAAAIVAALAWLGPGPAWWSVRAALRPAGVDAAWARVPQSAPAVATVDVRGLLASPIARSVRPQLEALALRHGFDLALAEHEVDVLVAASDASGLAHAVATGFELSPLVLPRFAAGRWSRVTVPGPHGTTWPAVTDGTTYLMPLEPGVVAWRPASVPQEHLVASLESAAAAPRAPLPLDGTAMRLEVTVDDQVRAAAARGAQRLGGRMPTGVERVEVSVVAGEVLVADVRLAHATPEQARDTINLVNGIETARRLGLLALLGGREGQLLSRLPPAVIVQDGALVTLTMELTSTDLAPLLDQLG